jgi:nitrous oxidase accessory protein
MRHWRHRYLLIWLLLIAVSAAVIPASAQEPGQQVGRIESSAGSYTSLTAALIEAEPGATLHVYGGSYDGPITIDRPVTLIGYDWPVIDGRNLGNVIEVTAPNVTIRGFVVRNSGDSLDDENTGIAVEAPYAVIENNRLEETLFGVYLREAGNSVVRGNIINSMDLPVPRRGDPIRAWYSHHVLIENNIVNKGRDVVLWYSEDLIVRGNEVRDGRYGIHFMYCDDALIEQNLLLNNSVGTFMMYSRRLHMIQNTVANNRGPSGYGLGLKDMDDAVVEYNLFLDNRVGMYLDNSPREVDSVGHFVGNVIAYNDIGVEMMPSVRHNEFSDNSFVDNGEQVGIAGGGGGRLQENEWTVAGQGNYWSDYAGYDGSNDGRGDIPYRAEKLFENLMDQNTSLRLFLYSPIQQAVDFAARAIPFVRPQPKLVDEAPLMAPLVPAGLPAAEKTGGASLWVASAVLLLVAVLVWQVDLRAGRKGTGGKGKEETAGTNIQPGKGKLMVKVEKLSKQFGKVIALNNLTFEIQAGEAVALWGANGAGKTTALRCLLGVIPYKGTVRLGEFHSTWQGKAVRRLLGFVPQEINFHDDLTVQETLHFYARLKKTAVNTPHTATFLQQLGLDSHLEKQVGELSGGMKQRLALAIALLADPPVLILDEPTANLDIRAREQFLSLLAELKTAGKTLIFSSHRPDEVTALADRVLVLENGRVVADCPPAQLSRYLGEWAMLKLHLSGEQWIGPAVETLNGHGFQVRQNGTGVWVRVEPLEKARPFTLLTEAGIPVSDFQLDVNT